MAYDKFTVLTSSAATKKAVATEKFLGGMVLALRQIYSLWKQFGDEQTWFRVVGGGIFNSHDGRPVATPVMSSEWMGILA